MTGKRSTARRAVTGVTHVDDQWCAQRCHLYIHCIGRDVKRQCRIKGVPNEGYAGNVSAVITVPQVEL